MYRQKESELNAIFRDTEGHETSVKLKFAYAAFSFAALTLFHYATHYVFLIYTLVLYGIPLQLLFSALSEIVHHRKAKARQLAGFDDLPKPKSTRKMTFLVFAAALLLVQFSMGTPNEMNGMGGAVIIGPLIFVGVMGYRIYLAIYRPTEQPDLKPTRGEAIMQTNRIAAQFMGGMITRAVSTAIFVGVTVLILFYLQQVSFQNDPVLFN